MKQQLNILVSKLNTDKFSAVTIKNLSDGKKIYTDLLSADIIQDFGSAESLFDSIYNSGYTELKVQPRRKNGNSFKDDGVYFTIEAEKEETETEIEKEEKKKKKKKKKLFQDAGNSNTMLGLSQLDILKLHSKAEQYEKAKEEVKEWKSEAKDYKKKYEDVKEELLQKKYTVESSDSRNNMVAGLVSGLSSAVPQLVEAFAKKPMGLGAPQEVENLSEVKTNFINNIKLTDDSLNGILNAMLVRISQKGEGDTFEAELMQLLISQKIITNG